MTSPTGSKKRKNNTPTQDTRLRTQDSGSGVCLGAGVLGLRRGLTLIEVLISVILLAGGAVLVMQSFATGWEAIVRADERANAYLFALSKLADLELANQQGRDLAERTEGSFRAGAKPFSWHLDVRAGEKSANSAQLVTLSVSWPRGKTQDGAEFSMLLPAAQAGKERGAS